MKKKEDVVEWIHSFLPFGIKPGLQRMEALLKELGHPEKKLKAVHVGGTNGKGSTVSFIRHALEEAGYVVGTFTSPYVECFEERISVNGEPIEAEDLVDCANVIRPLVERLAETELGSPTEFEVITTIAFYYFAKRSDVDIVLFEVGLGGRYDSTNVITPLISVITSIGYDHMHILGSSLEAITREKVGIMKRGVPLVSGVAQREAKAIIRKTAEKMRAPYYQLRDDFNCELVTVTDQEQRFVYTDAEGKKLECKIRMKGPHQRNNAAVAIQTLQLLKRCGFSLSDRALKRGLAKTTWPGRFEIIHERPLIILDGAHNEQGMTALSETLNEIYPERRFHFLIGATKEKEMKTLLKPLESFDATFTFTSFSFFRAKSAVALYEEANVEYKSYEENWEKAFANIVTTMNEDDVFVVCGSLYFISEVREKWNRSPSLLRK